MKTLKVLVCKAGKGFSASIEEVDGFVITRSKLQDIKDDLRESLEFHIQGLYSEEHQQWMNEPYQFTFVMDDVASILGNFDGVLNQSSLARISGINESLMRQYALGIKRPGANTMKKIRNGLDRFANELQSVAIV